EGGNREAVAEVGMKQEGDTVASLKRGVNVIEEVPLIPQEPHVPVDPEDHPRPQDERHQVRRERMLLGPRPDGFARSNRIQSRLDGRLRCQLSAQDSEPVALRSGCNEAATKDRSEASGREAHGPAANDGDSLVIQRGVRPANLAFATRPGWWRFSSVRAAEAGQAVTPGLVPRSRHDGKPTVEGGGGDDFGLRAVAQ